jgi:hypothetical protein
MESKAYGVWYRLFLFWVCWPSSTSTIVCCFFTRPQVLLLLLLFLLLHSHRRLFTVNYWYIAIFAIFIPHVPWIVILGIAIVIAIFGSDSEFPDPSVSQWSQKLTEYRPFLFWVCWPSCNLDDRFLFFYSATSVAIAIAVAIHLWRDGKKCLYLVP